MMKFIAEGDVLSEVKKGYNEFKRNLPNIAVNIKDTVGRGGMRANALCGLLAYGATLMAGWASNWAILWLNWFLNGLINLIQRILMALLPTTQAQATMVVQIPFIPDPVVIALGIMIGLGTFAWPYYKGAKTAVKGARKGSEVTAMIDTFWLLFRK